MCVCGRARARERASSSISVMLIGDWNNADVYPRAQSQWNTHSSILRLIVELQSGLLLYSHKRSSEYSRIGGGSGGGGGGGNGISQFTSLLSDWESSAKIMAALAPFRQPRWRHKSVALIGILNDQTSSPSLITSSAGGTADLTAISHKLNPLPLEFWIA